MYPIMIMLIRSMAVNGLKNYAIVFESMSLYQNLINSCLIVSGLTAGAVKG